jgi:hypothetical protein
MCNRAVEVVDASFDALGFVLQATAVRVTAHTINHPNDLTNMLAPASGASERAKGTGSGRIRPIRS